MQSDRFSFVFRFPTTLLAAFTAALLSLLAVNGIISEHLALFRTALIGIPIGFAFDFVTEMNVRLRRSKPLPMAAALGLLFIFFVVASYLSSAQYATCVILAHLAVALVPLRLGNSALWNFNRLLFIRCIVSSLFALVLFTGLALAWYALGSIVGLGASLIGSIGSITFGIFHPLYFLHGIPDWKNLERSGAPSKNLQFFSERILIPLVVLNALIIYLFCARAVFATVEQSETWLFGILLLVTAATLAHVLVWPKIKTSNLAKYYSRFVYVALLPILLVAVKLAYADGNQHSGISLVDYYTFVFAIWVTLAAVYFGLMQKTELRSIPVSIAIVALFTLGGPFGAERTIRNSVAAHHPEQERQKELRDRKFQDDYPARAKARDLEDRGITEGTRGNEAYQERRIAVSDYGSYETKGYLRFAAIHYSCCTSAVITGGVGVDFWTTTDPNFELSVNFGGFDNLRDDDKVKMKFDSLLSKLWSAKDRIYKRGEVVLDAAHGRRRVRLIVDEMTIRRYVESGKLEVMSLQGYLLF